MKELGVGWAVRTAAKGIKPRLVISGNGGKWTVRSETTLKTTTYDFTPGVEFDETTPDGREVKVQLHFYIPLIVSNLSFIVDYQVRR
jgi:fatty acid-binding protein 3